MRFVHAAPMLPITVMLGGQWNQHFSAMERRATSNPEPQINVSKITFLGVIQINHNKTQSVGPMCLI